MAPRVEDMTGFSVVGPCKHPILFFGNSGRVVICSSCSHLWESTSTEFTEIDLNEEDKRVAPPEVEPLENESVVCRNCDSEFVTAKDEPGKCPLCGGSRKLETI